MPSAQKTTWQGRIRKTLSLRLAGFELRLCHLLNNPGHVIWPLGMQGLPASEAEDKGGPKVLRLTTEQKPGWASETMSNPLFHRCRNRRFSTLSQSTSVLALSTYNQSAPGLSLILSTHKRFHTAVRKCSLEPQQL